MSRLEASRLGRHETCIYINLGGQPRLTKTTMTETETVPRPATGRRQAVTPPAILLLAGLAAAGQFASNIYTPSLPAAARDFGAPGSALQATLAAFLATFAQGQLAAGPLADRYGRRPIMAAGFAVFLAASLGCALAPNVPALLTMRAAQGAGAAAGIAVSRAATRDSFEGPAPPARSPPSPSPSRSSPGSRRSSAGSSR